MTPRIASHPSFAPLEPRPCQSALMIADDAGMAALDALIGSAPELKPKATILRVSAKAPAATLPAAIAGAVSQAKMGLQVWLAGSHGLIAQAQAQLLAAGLPKGAIQAQHCGSPARRMQCVHCKTIAEEVMTDPYTCPGCGRALFVRDHFSARLGAFQGVCIDAETPGDIPQPQELRA
ncbi:dimethylamine monooxygenase subunit DmmA family protein [Paracoccus shanxieyensis]|uniref:Dimethylamine monooxygenase subunit DmmA-like C-terminal domain-containing protein n=1 Tax=Paracoccus shanxieyensis TaxID=2675752 RepID=A0A6L6IZX3_9RHOB|nr:dimethylamine monooxygenase subunit DmmA family protein [Paracoccus shanxieyensis]MTH65479.1 hypothetical protein [Paracoccus shanxieyensis]MTH88725.1 hypothetical protein [Paracoccus shanxieyensis]